MRAVSRCKKSRARMELAAGVLACIILDGNGKLVLRGGRGNVNLIHGCESPRCIPVSYHKFTMRSYLLVLAPIEYKSQTLIFN
jgi:hypothetical protein